MHAPSQPALTWSDSDIIAQPLRDGSETISSRLPSHILFEFALLIKVKKACKHFFLRPRNSCGLGRILKNIVWLLLVKA